MDSEALDNESDYFAELTESYFWKNNYYPFDRTDLFAYDPVGAEMI